ncbi:hypothetical protein NJ76_01865 [Rhodococcus sp. IITR03]|nr:hypothetical protein NJ76_01865 [Rhodococcus sp. IITR03]
MRCVSLLPHPLEQARNGGFDLLADLLELVEGAVVRIGHGIVVGVGIERTQQHTAIGRDTELRQRPLVVVVMATTRSADRCSAPSSAAR